MQTLSEKYLLRKWPRIQSYVFDEASPSDNPVTVFLGGQPAAGKTSGQEIASRMHPALVPIVGDEYRQFHPLYNRLLEHDSIHMPKITAQAAGVWTGMCVDYANDNGYSILIEGTWRNPETVLKESRRAKLLGRETHAILVATPPDVSRISTLTRYYGAKNAGQAARWTPPTAHDDTVGRLSHNVYVIADDESIDRFTVTDRKGNILADGVGEEKANCCDIWLQNFERPLTDEELADVQKAATFVHKYLKMNPTAAGLRTAQRILLSVEEDVGLVPPLQPVSKGRWVQNRHRDGSYAPGGHWE